MVKKQGHDHLGKWDEDGRQSPDMFYQKVYPEQSLNKIAGHRRHSLDNGLGRHETDDSDDLEAETSDSSEIDYQWQLNVSKSNGVPNGVGSKIRRPSPKQTKSTEIRLPVVIVGFLSLGLELSVADMLEKKSAEMSQTEVHQMKQKQQPIPLGTLIGRELRNEKVENPTIFDGHNGISAAIFAKENLLNNVLSAIPQGLGETSGTTVTFVVIDGWTVTVASVGDSRCILDTQGGVVSLLTVDHRLEENIEERERVTASGGEVGRLNVYGGSGVGPLRCWPGGLCLSRSIGDTDVGEFIVPIPHVKQVKEALRSRGLKDDTTCLVVDIIPYDHPVLPATPKKKQNLLSSFIFGKRSQNSSKGTNKLSAIGVVEELFEEGSAMLAERLGKDFPLDSNSGLFRCAICQVDQPPSEGLSVNSGPFFSPASKPWEGPFLCASCRRKKDAMEGKKAALTT
ncbi:hypothetical protein DH2020_003229 [Rehmannia glutinosa]|uniref:PPM-type phosphatase domain-containing protein n=1 Tax=Rehmannia glutinosa TaxID=99300 RepID=A0ABR0XL56_REHGL